MSGATPITKKYIIEAKGSGLAFFDYDNDDGSTSISPTEPASIPTGHPAKLPPRIFTRTIATEPSPTSQKSPASPAPAGRRRLRRRLQQRWLGRSLLLLLGHNVLFHNNGDGTFTDVTRKAGVYDEQIRWGAGCTWLDYDRDGRLDLFVCNYIKLDPEKTPPRLTRLSVSGKRSRNVRPRGLTGDTNVLFHNNGDGTFTDVSAKSGILKPGPRYCITAVSYDFDNDGWPDIYVAVDSEPSILFHNNHDGTFTDVAVIAGCAYSENGHEQAGMGVAVADYDCDGWLDIFKTNFADDTCNLYHNNGDGTFSDVTFSSGIGISNQYVAWGCGFIDYDNDGWPDILQINGHVYPKSRAMSLGRPTKIHAWSTRTWVKAASRMSRQKWDLVSASASPAAARPSGL